MGLDRPSAENTKTTQITCCEDAFAWGTGKFKVVKSDAVWHRQA